MLCPKCQKKLKSLLFHNVEVDYCPVCLGIFFEEEELKLAKDEKDKNLKWFDIDLWDNAANFKIEKGIRLCPACRVPLYETEYGNSKIQVDVCNVCKGIWLDRLEFKKIIGWMKERADYEIFNNYGKIFFKEAAEIFSGPKEIREEITDFWLVLKLMEKRYIVGISKIMPIVWPIVPRV